MVVVDDAAAVVFADSVRPPDTAGAAVKAIPVAASHTYFAKQT